MTKKIFKKTSANYLPLSNTPHQTRITLTGVPTLPLLNLSNVSIVK